MAKKVLKATFTIGTTMGVSRRKKLVKQADGTVVTKMKRSKKDPTKPKRCKSPYIFFLQKMQPVVHAENPEMKMTEISSIIGSMWRKLPECSRAQWVKMAEEDRARYFEAIKIWKENKKTVTVYFEAQGTRGG